MKSVDLSDNPTCWMVTDAVGRPCGDPASRLVTFEQVGEVPLCEMHAMEFKPVDGYLNRSIE